MGVLLYLPFSLSLSVCVCVCMCRKQYNLDISDHEQPLLVHRPKKRERGVVGAEGGGDDADRIICLIPELCNMTGRVGVVP